MLFSTLAWIGLETPGAVRFFYRQLFSTLPRAFAIPSVASGVILANFCFRQRGFAAPRWLAAGLTFYFAVLTYFKVSRRFCMG